MRGEEILEQNHLKAPEGFSDTKQPFFNNRLAEEVHRLDFPEQTLRLALKIREKCSSGKTHVGFHETQLARRIVRRAGEIQKTDGRLPLIATWPREVLQLEVLVKPQAVALPPLHPRRRCFSRGLRHTWLTPQAELSTA